MRKVKTAALVWFSFMCSIHIFAQENPRENRPVGLSIYGGGPPLFASVTIDYFVSPTWSVEFGGGFYGIYTGGRYHFKGETEGKKWTPYTGLL